MLMKRTLHDRLIFFPPPFAKEFVQSPLTLVLILIDFSSIFCMVMMDAADESADGVGK